jgi:glucose-1-phosphate thymidylyltransferase
MGDGSQWGLSLSYAVQDQPRGLAHAFIVARSFIGDDDCMMILGDNIFFGSELSRLTRTAVRDNRGATIFAYPVKDPERFGVIEFDKQRRPTNIVEKPASPRSNFAVTGMYVYDNEVVGIADELAPSDRGELEITDLNMRYLANGRLDVMHMGRGMAWLDTGTHEALLEASHFVQTIEHRQGLKIACPEEVAWRLKWIDDAALERVAREICASSYADYLIELLHDEQLSDCGEGGGTGSAFWDAVVSDGSTS